MKMYIEDFIIQETITIYCILRLIRITTKCGTNFVRTMIGAIIHVAFSIALALFDINPHLYNLISLLLPLFVVLIIYKKGFKKTLSTYLLFFGFSLSIKGLILSLASTTFYSSVGIITYTKYSPLLILTSIIIFTYIYEALLMNAKLKIKSNSFIYKVNLYFNGTKTTINAYIDTGNLAKVDGKGILIIDYITFLELTKRSNSVITNLSTLSISTATAENKIKIFNIDKLEIINNKNKICYTNQLVGIAPNTIFAGKDYKALLSPEML